MPAVHVIAEDYSKPHVCYSLLVSNVLYFIRSLRFVLLYGLIRWRSTK